MYSMRTIFFFEMHDFDIIMEKNYINTRCNKNKPQNFVKLPVAITWTRTKVGNLVHNSMYHNWKENNIISTFYVFVYHSYWDFYHEKLHLIGPMSNCTRNDNLLKENRYCTCILLQSCEKFIIQIIQLQAILTSVPNGRTTSKDHFLGMGLINIILIWFSW